MNKWYRFSLLTSCVLMMVVLTAGLAMADIFTYTAELSGANEVPPNDSTAFGLATLTIDQGADLNVPLQVEFSGLSSAQTGCHIHFAPAGSNGGVIFPLGLGSPLDTFVFFDLVSLANLYAGNLYLNVHTEVYPGGEIRGNFYLTNTVDSEDTSWGSIKTLYR